MDKLKMHSPDLTAANIEKIAELFPTVVTESIDENGEPKRVVDFERLRQELSDHVIEGPQERYQLDWPGKRAAAFAANAPIAKTLRPLRDESVNFDTTKNLFIEGDNLDALKLLQESYLGKISLIYIDPPYNTGSDLVYHDDFAESSGDFLVRSAQVDADGSRLTSNTETNGRYHSHWLSMMYSRLKIARQYLRADGVIAISIDDSEQASLRRLADEVFGERNFVAQLVWEKGRKNDAKLFSSGHEYILIYARSMETLRESDTKWREEKPGAREIWDKYTSLRERHHGDDAAIEADLTRWFSTLPKTHPSKKWSRYRRIDRNGPWRDRDISWPGGDGPRYEVLHPVTKRPCKVPDSGWRFASPREMQRQIELGLVVFRPDETEPPFRKAYLRPLDEESTSAEDEDNGDEDAEDTDLELATQVRGTYFYKQSQVAVRHLRDLMGSKVFNNPKDHVELSRLFEYLLSGRDGIVMDFFAGSASTVEAVFEMNARAGMRCPVIVVQLPEDLYENLRTARGAAKQTIKNAIRLLESMGRPSVLSELSKERIRRAGQRVLVAFTDRASNLDVGFRVLRVDTTNTTDVLQLPDQIDQARLNFHVDNIKPDRSAEDLLFQVLLEWGLEVSLPIETERIDEYQVLVVDDAALIACFDKHLNLDLVRAIARRKPLRAVLLDAGFSSDDARINAEQIFGELSPSTDVKTI